MLHTSYFWAQMLIHRSFLPRVKKNPDARCGRAGLSRGFPSIVLCGNAARLSCHVLHIHAKRGNMPLPHMLAAVFHAAVVVLVYSWGSKLYKGLVSDSNQPVEDIKKCLEILAIYETRYQVAGRYRLSPSSTSRKLPCTHE